MKRLELLLKPSTYLAAFLAKNNEKTSKNCNFTE